MIFHQIERHCIEGQQENAQFLRGLHFTKLVLTAIIFRITEFLCLTSYYTDSSTAYM